MNVERETLITVGMPVAATVGFIVAVAAVGVVFDAEGIDRTGALAVIGVMVLFIVGLGALGLATSDEDAEE